MKRADESSDVTGVVMAVSLDLLECDLPFILMGCIEVGALFRSKVLSG